MTEHLVMSRCHRFRGKWKAELLSPIAIRAMAEKFRKRSGLKMHWEGHPDCHAAPWGVRRYSKRRFYSTPRSLRCQYCEAAFRKDGPYGKFVPPPIVLNTPLIRARA